VTSARSPTAGKAGEQCQGPRAAHCPHRVMCRSAGREEEVPLPDPGQEDGPRPWLQQEAGAIILVISLQDLKPTPYFSRSFLETPLTPRRFWLGLRQPELKPEK